MAGGDTAAPQPRRDHHQDQQVDNILQPVQPAGEIDPIPESIEMDKGWIQANNPNITFSRCMLNDKAMLKGFRVRKWIDQLLHHIIDAVVDQCERRGDDDEVEVAVRMETADMEKDIASMGCDVPLSFGNSLKKCKVMQQQQPSSFTQEQQSIIRCPKPAVWRVIGGLCECYFEEDEEYYPAQINAFVGDIAGGHADSQANVTYLGYDDNTVDVPLAWLRAPSQETLARHTAGGDSGNQHIRFDGEANEGEDEEEEEGYVDSSSALVTLQASSSDNKKGQKRPRDDSSTSTALAIFPADGKDEAPPAGVPLKYWMQRFRLFSQFDRGAKLDAEGWFSVTPERIAAHIAERSRCDVVVDLMVGCGGNAIQFALTCHHVIAIDIDPVKLACARHNAKIYGVADRIEFILGDATAMLPLLRPNVIFLSPPWGGPEYLNQPVYSLDRISCAMGGKALLELVLKSCPNVAVLLPRNVNLKEIAELSGGRPCEIEENVLNYKTKTITVYFGDYFLPAPPSDNVKNGKQPKRKRKNKNNNKKQQQQNNQKKVGEQQKGGGYGERKRKRRKGRQGQLQQQQKKK